MPIGKAIEITTNKIPNTILPPCLKAQDKIYKFINKKFTIFLLQIYYNSFFLF